MPCAFSHHGRGSPTGGLSNHQEKMTVTKENKGKKNESSVQGPMKRSCRTFRMFACNVRRCALPVMHAHHWALTPKKIVLPLRESCSNESTDTTYNDMYLICRQLREACRRGSANQQYPRPVWIAGGQFLKNTTNYPIVGALLRLRYSTSWFQRNLRNV
jgi:hypothetical protein